ncbi:hypothetical protein MPL1_02283 [Methylophaga lonarensis MPL]|uniref:Lipoprotein n=1 Tax=Methylophaga lonarensis MPL TaxID=1286106 RepID=M7P358_9GAMM|nr:hypothetical protein [Methylophaga lonarensis]EMR13951.1 hypothetical protein MPL1_02283 [Methylophaga lonarensis MPL]
MKQIAVTMVAGWLILLTGCALNTSGVRTVGPDTYNVMTDDMNASTAKGAALEQAERHCAEMGKQVLVSKISMRKRMRYTYDVTFLCLNEGDPKLVRPEYETIIEVQ